MQHSSGLTRRASGASSGSASGGGAAWRLSLDDSDAGGAGPPSAAAAQHQVEDHVRHLTSLFPDVPGDEVVAAYEACGRNLWRAEQQLEAAARQRGACKGAGSSDDSEVRHGSGVGGGAAGGAMPSREDCETRAECVQGPISAVWSHVYSCQGKGACSACPSCSSQ